VSSFEVQRRWKHATISLKVIIGVQVATNPIISINVIKTENWTGSVYLKNHKCEIGPDQKEAKKKPFDQKLHKIFMCINMNPNHLYTNMQRFSFIWQVRARLRGSAPPPPPSNTFSNRAPKASVFTEHAPS
jgi:hypothetical protein